MDYVGVMSQQPRKHEPRRIRSAPKFSAFLLTGALAGLVLGLVLGVTGPADARYDSFTAPGLLGLIFAGLGALTGGVVAVLLEKRP